MIKNAFDFDVAVIIGLAAMGAVQAAVLARAKKRAVRLMPAILSAVGALAAVGAAVVGFMILEQDAAESTYIMLLTAAFFGAGIVGCGLAALCGAAMKSRAAVAVPFAAVVLAVGMIFAAEWQRGAFDHNWDLLVRVDEISASEDGGLLIAASDLWDGAEINSPNPDPTGQNAGGGNSYSLVVPEKLAEKYNLFEGMILPCDVKEKNGASTVTKIDGLYKK